MQTSFQKLSNIFKSVFVGYSPCTATVTWMFQTKLPKGTELDFSELQYCGIKSMNKLCTKSFLKSFLFMVVKLGELGK